jgi:protein-tyrosine phosphatase
MGNMRIGHTAWDATQVWERLWVGGLDDAEELAGGNPHRITTVVSLSEIPIEARRASIAYLHFAIEDDKPVSVRQFDRILDALSENLRWGQVLLNCSVGVSRAPSIAAAYMDAVGYKNIDAALDEIRQVRPSIYPSNILLKSLKENLQ